MSLIISHPQLKAKKTDNVWTLIIPKNVTIDEPLRLQKNPGKATFELRLEEGAKATIIEEWHPENNLENDYQLNVQCEPQSQLTYIVLHTAGSEAAINEKRHFELEEGAKAEHALFCFGGSEIESHITQKAIGPRANMQMAVLCKAKEDQKMSFKTAQIFDEKHSQGHMEMKGVAEGQSQLNLNGLIKITKNGGETDASLDEHILNLSQQTKVDAAPALEIDTNDVKAAHSAGIHNVSEEEILYLTARGLEKDQAKQMLVSGFLKAGLDAVKKYPELCGRIEEIIQW